jgi:hypothetical protein
MNVLYTQSLLNSTLVNVVVVITDIHREAGI